ncbi:MAG: PAS domain S-box protein, partial [Desulfonatronovibrionaceae bacterium]
MISRPAGPDPGKKFSTFLSWALIILSAVSLTVVMGILYIILGRTMTREFYNQLEAEQTKVSMALQDRFNEVETTLREIASDNVLRVGLMLGMNSQISETLQAKYSTAKGVLYFVSPASDPDKFAPDPPQEMGFPKAHLRSLPRLDRMHARRFKPTGGNNFFTFYSAPIMRRDKRLGTAFAVYDHSRDTRFWEHLSIEKKTLLCIRHRGGAVDLRTGERLALPKSTLNTAGAEPVFPGRFMPGDKSVVPLKSFPDLMYVASSEPLKKRHTSLLMLLAGLFGAMLCLAFGASVLIARKVSRPLADMAEQAQAIAREPSHNFLQEKNIRYREFRKLARAFNHVLAGLLQAQEELQTQAQKRIEASESRYQRVVETSPAGIFSVDGQGRILFANPTLEEMTGYSAAELTSMHYHRLLLPEDQKAGQGILPELAGRDRGEESDARQDTALETRWVRRDGRIIWVEARMARVVEEHLETVLINAMDVTERKTAEQALRQSEQKYRSVINQSHDCIYLLEPESKQIVEANPAMLNLLGYTRDELLRLRAYDFVIQDSESDIDTNIHQVLENGELFLEERSFRKKDGDKVKVELSCNLITYNGKQLINIVSRDLSERKKIEEERLKRQKLESIGVLAGGLAHDFNNLLTGIVGNISLARKYAGSDEKLTAPLKKAKNACYSAQGIAQQLLTFSKGGVPVKSTVSISRLLQEAVSFSLHGSNIDCEFHLPEDLWDVEADRTQLSQVTSNLVINAQEAMPEGGQIRIEAENTVLDPSSGPLLPPGRYVHVKITDQGSGIQEEVLSRIFDPYFTTKEAGNGLGLAMVYSIVEKHGGNISVDSIPGAGSTFSIYLPAAKPSPPEQQTVENERLLTGKGQKILVMADEEIVLDVAR